MLGTVLSTGDSTMNKKDKTSAYREFTFRSGKGMGKWRRAEKRSIVGWSGQRTLLFASSKSE